MATPVDFTLYLITDRRLTAGRDLAAVIREALEGGVQAVQVREKDLSSKELYELAYQLRKVTKAHAARLIINDRVDVALAVDADGVHLGNASLPLYKVRKILGPKKLIGVSCHNQLNAITAQEKGADFITFGPVYHTPSKTIYGEPVGVERLADVAGIVAIPLFGLGGIKEENACQVMRAGASGIAVVSAVMAAADPRVATASLLSRVSDCRASRC